MAYKLYRSGYQNSYNQIFLKRCFEVFPLEEQLFGNPILEVATPYDVNGIDNVTEYPVVSFTDNPRASLLGTGLSCVKVFGNIIGNQLNVRRVGSNIPKRFMYDISNIIELEKTNPIFHLSASECKYDSKVDVDCIIKLEVEELKNKYPLLSLEVLERVIRMAKECSITEIDRAFDLIYIDPKKQESQYLPDLARDSVLPIISGEVVQVSEYDSRDDYCDRGYEILSQINDSSAVYHEEPLTDHLGKKLLFKCLYRPGKKNKKGD